MRRSRIACFAASVLFFSLMFIAGNAFAQAEPQAAPQAEPKPEAKSEPSRGDFNVLIQETQKKSDKSGEMSFVWWIPLEYWEYSFAQNPSVSPQQAERVVSVFKPYTLIAVVDGTMGQYGAVTYRPEEEVRRHVKLRDLKGMDYTPLAEADVSVEAKSFLAAMKPVLSSVLGPMGQNMYFFLFPSRDNGGQEISNAKKQGQLSVFLGEREFTWKLPLSSVLPPKSCPVCGAKVSGAYSFCPWDGAKLENPEPAS